jgi:hypothetical protein
MFICFVAAVISLIAGQHPGMPFDQQAAVHHFLIEQGGGTIQVTAKDKADVHTRHMIRQHLESIAAAFARGDFSSPLATHGEVPPGVEQMRQLEADLRYTYQETPDGGKVVIRSSSPDAIKAVHAFLTYQIKEHATGDPIRIQASDKG